MLVKSLTRISSGLTESVYTDHSTFISMIYVPTNLRSKNKRTSKVCSIINKVVAIHIRESVFDGKLFELRIIIGKHTECNNFKFRITEVDSDNHPETDVILNRRKFDKLEIASRALGRKWRKYMTDRTADTFNCLQLLENTKMNP